MHICCSVVCFIIIIIYIIRYYLKGPKVGQWDVFIDNLPALVDNITPTRQTPGFWAAGVVTRAGALFDFTADKPWIRLLSAKVIF